MDGLEFGLLVHDEARSKSLITHSYAAIFSRRLLVEGIMWFRKNIPPIPDQVVEQIGSINARLTTKTNQTLERVANPVEIAHLSMWIGFQAAFDRFGAPVVAPLMPQLQVETLPALVQVYRQLGEHTAEPTSADFNDIVDRYSEAQTDYVKALKEDLTVTRDRWGTVAQTFVDRVCSVHDEERRGILKILMEQMIAAEMKHAMGAYKA